VIEARDVLAVLDAFDAAGITVWIDGGWGVDALLGEQTRPHADLDVVLDIARLAAARAALGPLGFALTEDELPTRCVLQDVRGRQLDVHPVTFDAHGSGWQAQPSGPSFEYTAAGLAGQGVIGGRVVRCLSAELQLTTHQAYEPDNNDQHDVLRLCAHFGLELPPEYRSQACQGSSSPG
jgi:lincosamide nucleotidyltransferase A/C/D/E